MLNDERKKLHFSSLSIPERNMLYSAVHKSISSVYVMLLPSNHEDLYQAFLEDGLDSSIVLGAAIDGVRSATNCSIENRTLQGLLLS